MPARTDDEPRREGTMTTTATAERSTAEAPPPNEAPRDQQPVNVVVFRMNGDGSFAPRPGALPGGARTAQEAFSHWGATSAGGVNKGTSWVDTMRLPPNPPDGDLLEGAQALGLLHQPDGSESLIVLPTEADIRRLHEAFSGNLPMGDGLQPTFDAQGNAL